VKGIKKVIYKQKEANPPKEQGPWIRIKEAFEIGNITKPIAQLGGFTDGLPADLIGGPSPLAATIASGALGAGAGYLSGRGLEHFFPEKFQKGKLRKRLAIAGGLAGAIPGVWLGAVNHRLNGPKGWLMPFGATDSDQEHQAEALNTINGFLDILSEATSISRRETEKRADAFDGLAGGANLYVKAIDKDRFNRAVWDDPYLPDVYKGMTSGVVEGASQVAGYESPFISPMDIARIGIGMGTGWASGLVVGKTLGALAGISPSTQKTLQQAGIYAGLIKGTVPKLFG
jgi:hypothetical protein